MKVQSARKYFAVNTVVQQPHNSKRICVYLKKCDASLMTLTSVDNDVVFLILEN
jgi:hypothetical protein